MSPVTDHKRQQRQPYPLPLLTTPLYAIGWFAKKVFLSSGTSLFTQTITKFENPNLFQSFPRKEFPISAILAIRSFTKSPCGTGSRPMTQTHTHTDIATYRFRLDLDVYFRRCHQSCYFVATCSHKHMGQTGQSYKNIKIWHFLS